MATLTSTLNNDCFIIRFIRFENKEEDWLITEVNLQHEGRSLGKDIGPFLNEGEMIEFLNQLDILIQGRLEIINSNLMEPNLKFIFKKIDEIQYKVAVVFKKEIEYKNGKIEDSSNDKKITIVTNKEKIKLFIKEIRNEIKAVKKTLIHDN